MAHKSYLTDRVAEKGACGGCNFSKPCSLSTCFFEVWTRGNKTRVVGYLILDFRELGKRPQVSQNHYVPTILPPDMSLL